MITLDDVAKVVLDRLAAQAGYAATVPGKAWPDRGPDTPDGYPYIVSKIEAGPCKNTSGPTYTQPWTVRTAAYCPLGGGVTAQAVEQLMNDALASDAAQTALRAASLRNNTEKCLFAKVASGRGEYARELRAGADVLAASLTVEILFQGDRSVT